MIPVCPKNTKRMWSGYSLLHFMGDAKAHGQDLGKCKATREFINNKKQAAPLSSSMKMVGCNVVSAA